MSEKLIQWKNLLDFCIGVLMKLGVPQQDAFTVADNLVSANLRGIDSHGVARLDRYVDGIKTKYIIPDVKPKIIKESAVLANVDGQNGLGQVLGAFGMELAITKALTNGFGMVSVYNSNHYGYAGYFSMMALKYNLIGISMTNSAPLVVPTFGKNALMGTNPIAVAAPTQKNRPWVMDFATSTVSRGKIEVYNRLNKKMPQGWATDENGNVTDDPIRVERNLKDLLGGGLLPLGGAGEIYGGHKGYGLTVMIDIFSAILSGSNYGPHVVSKRDGKIVFPRVGHNFMVIDPEYFVGIDAFKKSMDQYIDELKNSAKAEGESRVYVHGEKEFEMQEHREKAGCPLDDKTVEKLLSLSRIFAIPIRFID